MLSLTKRIFIYIVVLAGVIGCGSAKDREQVELERKTAMPEESVVGTNKDKAVAVMGKLGWREQVAMYWEFFFEKGEKVPVSELPEEELDLLGLQGQARTIRAAWLGHSTLLLNIDGSLVLTDPVLERKVSIVGPTRFQKTLPLPIERVPKLDAVVISHDHYDHLNASSIRGLDEKTPLFLVPRGVGDRLRNWGIDDKKIVELAWGEEYQVNATLTATATPAQHFSGRGLFDRNRTLWASWVLQGASGKVFFSGDSGYFPGFKEIGHQYGPFDVAFIECGAYNEYWPKVHMFPEQTVQAALDLQARLLQPIHWATFNLALHPWYEPAERLTSAAWNRSVRLAVPKIGEVIDYRRPVCISPWWQPAMEKSMLAAGRGVAAEAIMAN